MNNFRALFLPLLIIFTAALLRLLPHLPNFTPIGAMAIFGGAYLSKKYSVPVLIATLLLSDYLLLYVNPFLPNWFNFKTLYPPTALIHSTTLFVYGSFLTNVFIGWLITKFKSAPTIIGGSLAASSQFFLVTNFGVWAMGAYSRGIDGLLESYIMGLPFFKYTVAGDLFYTILFFGGYEILLSFSKRFRHQSQAS